uniref:Transmembrane protein 171 n=1 Tax=Leptobrachium leishanense TaxID=445787 RepID=A0A8C5QQN2_9ANUR
MQPTFLSFAFGSHSPGCTSKFIFVMFVLGGMLFCAGFVLSVFGFQTCQMSSFSTCNIAFKVVGPSLAAIGLASILVARSKSRLERRRRQQSGDCTDPDSGFLCGESRQFVQFLMFGFLFVTSGILISVLGAWIPECASSNVNGTVPNSRHCDFLSLQIMGPLIVLIGLSFFVAAHINKRREASNRNDSTVDDLDTSRDEPFHITVGDEIILFPPPPPSYFADSSIARQGVGNITVMNENPPPYSSIFNRRSHRDGHNRVCDQENIYTIPMPSQSTEPYSNAVFPSDPPPKYEEKDPSEPTDEENASPSSSTVPEESSSRSV